MEPCALSFCFSGGYTRCFGIASLCFGCKSVLWLQTGPLVASLLTSKPRCTEWLLFPSQYLYGTIWPTLYYMRRCGSRDNIFRAWPIFFHWPSLLSSFVYFTVFPFSSFVLWIGIVWQGSSDWLGVNRSLPTLHCRPFL